YIGPCRASDMWVLPQSVGAQREALGEAIIVEEPCPDLMAPPGVEVEVPGMEARESAIEPTPTVKPDVVTPLVPPPAAPLEEGVRDSDTSAPPQADASRLPAPVAQDAPEPSSTAASLPRAQTTEHEAKNSRFNTMKQLEMNLTQVRQEITCWEEILADLADASKPVERVREALVVTPHSDDASVGTTDRDLDADDQTKPADDGEGELDVPVPPVDPVHAALLGQVGVQQTANAGAPVQERGRSDRPAGAVGDTEPVVPEITTVVTLDSSKERARVVATPKKVVPGPSVQAKRAHSAARRTSEAEAPRPTMAARVEVAEAVANEITSAWDATFGDVQDLLSVVRNELDCWQAEETSKASQTGRVEPDVDYATVRY
ncbi:MAG: hypothetical protein ACE5HE_13060, partial [Phycisphaerae bacterium]